MRVFDCREKTEINLGVFFTNILPSQPFALTDLHSEDKLIDKNEAIKRMDSFVTTDIA